MKILLDVYTSEGENPYPNIRHEELSENDILVWLTEKYKDSDVKIIYFRYMSIELGDGKEREDE